jgi:hypothetical protein
MAAIDGKDILCPTCGGTTTDGWIAMWNPIIGQKVRWQPDEPGYGRLRVPQGAKIVLRARFGGRDRRRAVRCSTCATTVIPRDPAYDA